MDKKIQTTNTYNNSAVAFAQKFDESGTRTADIEEVFSLIKKENPAVFEIGCGNGRDAKKIVEYTNNYLGIDISEKLIELAREKVPNAQFEVADIENYDFPGHYDVIFSFASLLHTPKEELKKIFAKIQNSLLPGGIFRISLKRKDFYQENTQTDTFGVRTFYYYSRKDIEELRGGLQIIDEQTDVFRNQEWLELTLQKV